MFSNILICNILDYIDLNLNTKIQIRDLEIKFFFNRYYIMKLFKKEIGETIFNYINYLRIYNSIKEIKNTNNSMRLISINNGFYSLEYFSETFKKIIGVSPRTFKNNKLSDLEYDKVIKSMIEIQEFIEKVNKYKNNLKPTIQPVKKLSIFK